MHVSSDRGEEGGGWFENVVVSDGGGVDLAKANLYFIGILTYYPRLKKQKQNHHWSLQREISQHQFDIILAFTLELISTPIRIVSSFFIKKKNMSYQEKKMHRFVFTIIQKA